MKVKSVVAERFIRTLIGKSYKRMTADDSKFYLGYLNKLVDEYNHTYHCSIDKKPIHADFSALAEEIESSHKTLEFKVSDRVRVTKHENIFSKSYTKN